MSRTADLQGHTARSYYIVLKCGDKFNINPWVVCYFQWQGEYKAYLTFTNCASYKQMLLQSLNNMTANENTELHIKNLMYGVLIDNKEAH